MSLHIDRAAGPARIDTERECSMLVINRAGRIFAFSPEPASGSSNNFNIAINDDGAIVLTKIMPACARITGFAILAIDDVDLRLRTVAAAPDQRYVGTSVGRGIDLEAIENIIGSETPDHSALL